MPNLHHKRLHSINPKSSGRNFSGKITVRGQGGRQKRYLRHIDWRRQLLNIPAKVESIEIDPNRSARIALLVYANGYKDYILAPEGLNIGDQVVSAEATEIKPGNSCLLKNVPIGVPVHNLEIVPGKGAQIVRSAGNSALVQSKDGDTITVKMPSGQIRIFKGNCRATIGALAHSEHKHEKLGKAGRSRLLGRRPTVRGTAQDPRSHPHGGGEGRSGIGMKSPKTPWGKRANKKTRKQKKYSNKVIINVKKRK